MDTFNNEPIEGRTCCIRKVIRDPSGRCHKPVVLEIKNLDKSMDHCAFHNLFLPIEAILSCKLSTDPETGESRGYGIVRCADEATAERAMEALNGKILNGKEM